MGMPDLNITQEQEKVYVTKIIEELKGESEKIQEAISKESEYIQETQKYMHDKVYEMDPTEVRANRQVLESMVDSAYGLVAKNRRFLKMINSPYFGRISFLFDDKKSADGIKRGSIVDQYGNFQIYIGIHSYIKSMKNIIYDWRSPIASMFYDYEVGRAQYIAPKGIITGEINLKRQYKISEGKLDYMFESDLTIDDEILQEQLSKATSDKMKNIVATIQKEQNAIIRDEKSDVLIIQGVAGSGKTSIALHRVAYLLYRLKDKIYSENMMIISPNKVFSDYISNVLPELGEDQILQMTFYDIAEHELDETCEFQDSYGQISELLENYDRNLIERIKFKSSNEFLDMMNGYISFIEKNNFQAETVIYVQDERGSYDLTRPFEISDYYINDRFYAYKRFPVKKRLDMIIEDIIDKIIDFYNIKRVKIRLIWLTNKIYSMFKDSKDILKLYADMYKHIGAEKMYTPKKIKINKQINAKTQLTHKVDATWIPYDDVAPLLYLKSTLFGVDSFLYVKQLLIDEMQDYSPVHYALFNRMFPGKKTILGDISQLVNPFISSSSQEGIAEIYAKIPKTTVNTMTLLKSYRSTTEITDFARRIIPNDKIQIIERHGDEPDIIKCKDNNEQVEKIIKLIKEYPPKGFKSIGIICKTDRQAANLHKLLKEKADIETALITVTSEKFTNDLVVTTAYLAKGLEFDCVILPDTDSENYKNDMDRQMIYIGITRALHKLTLLHTGEATGFLR
ncbi:MAG: ATP-binding domain-containing protein [Oscillospiraceae bacterium]|nr:ATP-binding domain-containing protein [Oscillospiraceae bacterium]